VIPVRVELTDFLSHRRPEGTPVVFDFEGAKLWSVSGDNGAGKSAIFDGITWTLYGVHRGGRQDSQRLISHGADGCKASFVFEVEGRRYRVERSLRRRGALKRQAQWWDAASGSWAEIPGTSSEAGFARWRDELVALSYAAFTHSVLLLQEGSDSLIRSGAKDRFEVLAQLVDLSSYQRLEQLAQTYSSELAGRRRRLDEELEGLEPVQDEERKAAAAQVKGLERQHRQCTRAVEAQIEVLSAARSHSDLVARLDRTRAEIASTERLVVDAQRIRAEAKEHELLTAAREKLHDGIAALAAAGHIEAAASELRHAGERIDLVRLEREADDARSAASTASHEADACAGKAAALAGALPAIGVVVDQRTELAEAETDVHATGTVSDLNAELKRLAAQVRELETAASEAAAARDAAAELKATREAELGEARKQLQARHAAGDEAVCSRCGQPVDEEHRVAELRRAEGEVAGAEGAVGEARDRHSVLADAATAAASARDRAVEHRRGIDARRTEAQGAERRLKRARAAAAKAARAAAFKSWDDPRRRAFATADAQGLASTLAELEAELDELNGRAADSKQAVAQAEEAARLAEEGHGNAVKNRAELERALEQARTEAAWQRQHADVLLADVAPEWADRARKGEDDVLAALDARRAVLADAAAKLPALEQAEGQLAKLQAGVDALTAQLKAFPQAHRVSVASAEEALEAARDKLAATDRALNDARLEVAALKEREQARAAKLDERARTRRQARLAARMVQLLGRQGLQGQLLVDATRALEELANETLMTLTGGALQLEIRFAEQRGRDELSVYARDFNAGGERTDAAFLSGSEKFRVCVAMAAAIGAYGSGRRRVESLIIDEGFGSLDEQRRGDMIDELRRLAGLLERVIVVSHQADFQNRAQFPHGYRLRRVDGATTVERYV
jgi:DNA repair exonuclease SbcCD ATPase subunit